MTDKQINIAVAELCGRPQPFRRSSDPKCKELFDGEWMLLPNYCHDLNAMHEAEKTLTEKQQVWYLQKLTQVRFKAGIGGTIGCMIDKTTFATARQRAEAFLRTLSKWKENA